MTPLCFKKLTPCALALSLVLPVPALATPATHLHGEAAPLIEAHAAAHTHACPMHPEQTGGEGDRCPICNMFLTPVAAAPSAHQHDSAEGHDDHADAATHTHACSMHPEQTGEEGDRCPICNMFLTPVAAAPAAHQQSSAEGHDDHAPAAIGSSALELDPLPQGMPEASSQGDTTTRYVCPMHPQIVSDEPGTCPICGMNLEMVETGGADEAVVVGVSGGMQQALGVRTQAVERGTLWRYVKTLGTVKYNEDAISHVHTRVSGWVERLAVNSVGERVKRGQLLYEIYSPELVNAQDDYLQALDYLKQDPARGQELRRKARLRLELLGIADSVIRQLERSGESLYRVPFYAEQDGTVSMLALREGMYVQPGETQIELVDLSTVWVIADVFENEQSWLEVGRYADVTAASQGLFELEGKIDYIYPELDPVTRAMQVRVKLDNQAESPQQKLRPGALVDVELFGGPRRDLLIVPTEALILTGRENRVVVQQTDDSFVSVPVRLGMISQGRAEILEGLSEGDRVVVSGQFLLDSEASIQGSLRRLSQQGGGESQAGHDHSAH
ncbi:efflux RND transporter periplasmic adaptor subunit [Ferrimonas gelatinilytica]